MSTWSVRQPAQAVLQCGEHAVPAVVAYPGQLRRAVEALGALHVTGRGDQPPANLGGQHELRPRAAGQEGADTLLGQAHAVVRRGIEGPDARCPRRLQRLRRRLLADRRVQAGDRRPAEDHLGHVQASSSQRHLAHVRPRHGGEVADRQQHVRVEAVVAGRDAHREVSLPAGGIELQPASGCSGRRSPSSSRYLANTSGVLPSSGCMTDTDSTGTRSTTGSSTWSTVTRPGPQVEMDQRRPGIHVGAVRVVGVGDQHPRAVSGRSQRGEQGRMNKRRTQHVVSCCRLGPVPAPGGPGGPRDRLGGSGPRTRLWRLDRPMFRWL